MQTSIASSYRKIKQMRRYDTEKILEWQDRNLKKIIAHAYDQTKYYRVLFDRIGITPKDISTQDDLRKLPILKKEDIRLNFDDLAPININSIPHKKSATGGSTGDPMSYLLDHRSWSFSNANTILNWERTGYHYGQGYIALGSTSLFVDKNMSLKHKFYYKLKNKHGLSGINMSDEVCKEYIDLIKKRKIHFLYGYASSIYLLAKYVLNKKINIDIHTCFPTSEILTERYRATINEAFRCEILDCYGAHDGGITAFGHQQGYFEVNYNCIVRLNNQSETNTGSALLTDLFNYAMPLINYQLGDDYEIDEVKNNDYPFNGQVINKVIGRTSDLIYLENGNVLTGPGFTILFKDLPVEYYCIEKNGINSVKCSIKKLSEFSDIHETLVASTIKKYIGADAHLSISYTNDIQYSKSGKRLFFKTG